MLLDDFHYRHPHQRKMQPYDDLYNRLPEEPEKGISTPKQSPFGRKKTLVSFFASWNLFLGSCRLLAAKLRWPRFCAAF